MGKCRAKFFSAASASRRIREIVDGAIQPAQRPSPQVSIPVVHFAKTNGAAHNGLPFSVRDSLRGKNILLIGATGFIGKVWLANLLTDLPGNRQNLSARPAQ